MHGVCEEEAVGTALIWSLSPTHSFLPWIATCAELITSSQYLISEIRETEDEIFEITCYLEVFPSNLRCLAALLF